jgi:phosphomannomutase/phosphoglucomutase
MVNQFAYLKEPKYRRPLVVVDAGNGTAGLIAPELLEKIGCDVIPLYCEPDGNFPNHHPDPTVIEYIQDMIAETKRAGADMGVGYDGDADRIGAVNKNGDIVWGDQLMMLLSRELLQQKPGSKVIADVKCSQLLFDDIQQHGGRPIMWKTGHSLIKQKMKDEGALLAGEFSGHIFIGDRYFGYDDAIYTTLRLVEIMKTTGKDIKELLSDIPRLMFTPEIRLDCPDEIKKEVVGSVVAAFRSYFQNNSSGSPHRIVELNMIDGVRVVFEKGWGLIRASNTQPVAVMRVEARDRESLEGYRSFLEKEFGTAVKSAQKAAGLPGPKYDPLVMQ